MTASIAPNWVEMEVVLAIQSATLLAHGGLGGVRDRGMLESALARPVQKFNYEPDTTGIDLAAAYAFGLTKNHPFIDGNKRVAFLVCVVFLEDNGYLFHASEADAAATFLALAAGNLSEDELAAWLRHNSSKNRETITVHELVAQFG